jgi:hypothetical protein
MNEVEVELLAYLKLLGEELVEIRKLLEEGRWECGCGTLNSISNEWCRTCKRRENERT